MAIALFALVMSLNGFVFGVVTVQLVPLLEAAGLAAAAAVWIASLKGFAQFGGRVVEITFGAQPARDHRRAPRDRRAAATFRCCCLPAAASR